MALRRRLPPLSSIRDFIHMYQLSAKKILSQNFLLNLDITRKIVAKSGVSREDYVIEVGPGPGGITRSILETDCKRLDVIELDRRFFPALEILVEHSNGRMFVHHGDILKFDSASVWKEAGVETTHWFDQSPNLHIIGNLPFHIASPLIVKWLKEMSERSGLWSFGRIPLTLTFQKEVAQRIVAPIDHPQRCRLSIAAQYVAEPTLLFTVSGQSFVPAADVDVGIVKLVPRQEILIRSSFELVTKVCRHIFHYRRKGVAKPAKTLYPTEMADQLTEELLGRCRINPKLNSMQLGMDEYRDMCYVYEQQCQRIPGLYLYDYRKPISLQQLALLNGALPPEYPFRIDNLPSQGLTLNHFNNLFNNI